MPGADLVAPAQQRSAELVSFAAVLSTVEPKLVERKLVEPKLVEPKLVEPKLVEPKSEALLSI